MWLTPGTKNFPCDEREEMNQQVVYVSALLRLDQVSRWFMREAPYNEATKS